MLPSKAWTFETTLCSVSLSISKNAYNASGRWRQASRSCPYTFVTHRIWSLTSWTLPTSPWDSQSFGNVKKLPWAHPWPLRYAVPLHYSENIVSYVLFLLLRGAMPPGCHFGHVQEHEFADNSIRLFQVGSFKMAHTGICM